MQDIETPKTNEVDFSRIVDTLKKSQDIRTDRINIDALTSLYEQGRLVMDFDESGELKKFGALWDSADPKWVEIGTLWVNPRHRGSGLSGEIFGALSNQANSLGKNVFLLSRLDKVAALAKGFSFSEDTAWSDANNRWDSIYQGTKSGDRRLFFREFVSK